jgi:Caudovirus prohead serine protease
MVGRSSDQNPRAAVNDFLCNSHGVYKQNPHRKGSRYNVEVSQLSVEPSAAPQGSSTDFPMSIGYDMIPSSMKDCARQLNEVKLYEVSLTPFPANDQAQVTAVKDYRDAVAPFCRVMAPCTKQIRGG